MLNTVTIKRVNSYYLRKRPPVLSPGSFSFGRFTSSDNDLGTVVSASRPISAAVIISAFRFPFLLRILRYLSFSSLDFEATGGVAARGATSRTVYNRPRCVLNMEESASRLECACTLLTKRSVAMYARLASSSVISSTSFNSRIASRCIVIACSRNTLPFLVGSCSLRICGILSTNVRTKARDTQVTSQSQAFPCTFMCGQLSTVESLTVAGSQVERWHVLKSATRILGQKLSIRASKTSVFAGPGAPVLFAVQQRYSSC